MLFKQFSRSHWIEFDLFRNFLLPVAVVRGRTRSLVERFEMKERSSTDEFQAPDTSPESLSEVAKTSPMLVRSLPPPPPPPAQCNVVFIFCES